MAGIPAIDLGPDGALRGGHLLLARALASASRLRVRGELASIRAWCRSAGHEVVEHDGALLVTRGPNGRGPFARAGAPRVVSDVASPRWGLAARGAEVETSAPAFDFPLSRKDEVWADEAAKLYAQAAAAQWDPAAAIPWSAPFDLPDDVEDAVVQVMTYLCENETAALLVPARFCARIHPHFREITQLLAVQAADEARHLEVFTRRALLRRPSPGRSTAGGQASLQTLVDEPDFALAELLLGVMGEGSFLALLRFLAHAGPDPVTRAACRLAGQDEARHVAFGVAHLRRRVVADPAERTRLALAIERRNASLAHTTGLNAEVYDALVLLAAGAWDREALARGHDAVAGLIGEMDVGRRQRLETLGFEPDEAARLSALHTRNFM